jgi:aminotransferase MxcL
MVENMRVDVTTTSVGRSTLIQAYDSFFTRVRFSGSFRVIVTIDPAYQVSADEIERTRAYLLGLTDTFPQIEDVVVDQFPRQVGLQSALTVLMAYADAPVGVHLEDDWEIIADVDLDGLVADLHDQGSTAIMLGNEHVARGGTFEHADQVDRLTDTRVPLLRLTGASWAKRYLPLCPHVHRTAKWKPTIAHAFAVTDQVDCPDERVREFLTATQTWQDHNVLWTEQIAARDIGRSWLANRDQHKAITPRPRTTTALPHRESRGRSLALDRSLALLDRARQVIPGITQTFRKRPENFAAGHYPVYVERGDGALVWDVDGNDYLDFVAGLGACTLGHNHPAVTTTIRERVSRGVLMSLPSPSELSVSELIVGSVPGIDMVRLLKTGADACSAAIRLARHMTKRDAILSAGYHGWHDQLVAEGHGVPQAVSTTSRRVRLDSPADDAKFLDTIRRQRVPLAAVLLSTPYQRKLDPQFMVRVREACTDTGTLLVLDEVVTGFRLAPGGLGEFTGVHGDIVCFSKGLAAGMPLAAVAGPAGIMRDFGELTVSSTFGGELLSIEVAKAALREYGKSGYYPKLAALGRRMRDGINDHAVRNGMGHIVAGYDPMPCLLLKPGQARDFLAEMALRGILLTRDVNFITAAHTEAHIDCAVDAAGDALRVLSGKWSN